VKIIVIIMGYCDLKVGRLYSGFSYHKFSKSKIFLFLDVWCCYRDPLGYFQWMTEI
jgi:hypothetical protein